MRVCTSDQMHSVDKIAEERFNIPSIVLMENAAAACVRETEGFESFVILCGKGNNGGDGLACARHLIAKGRKVSIFLLFGDDFSGDALINYNILKSMNTVFFDAYDMQGLERAVHDADCVIDAIFGTGMHGGAQGRAKTVIETVNRAAKYRLSIDVPSGINADSGEIETVCIKADKTVTLAAYKTGLLMYPAASFTGEIICADITIPEAAYDICKTDIRTIEGGYIRDIMPKRQADSHKGDYGKILIIGGSRGMAGAVCMAAEAAFKAGAGLVTACVPHEINDIVQVCVPNAMTYPADFENDADEIAARLGKYDVILFGNGIGRSTAAMTLLEKVMCAADKMLIIDADGLYLLSQDLELIKKCRAELILTPHTMEMARLADCTPERVEKNRLEISKEFVLREGLTLVLKGNHSIITAPDGKQSVNLTGNSGMATAGSGDVLAGMAAGFAGAGLPAQKVCELAVYLHAMAGDYAKRQFSEYAMTAPDIINSLSHILPVEI